MIEWFNKLTDPIKIVIIVLIAYAVLGVLFALFKWLSRKKGGTATGEETIQQGDSENVADEEKGKGDITEPVPLLLDEPVGSVKEDILDLRPFADVIAGAALGTEGPFTVGVYADWGEGKTSVLRLAKELVENSNPDIVTVWFNAWQYGKEIHPIIPLVSTIEKSVNKKLKSDKTRSSLKDGLDKISKALRAIAYGFSVNIPGVGDFAAKEMIDRYNKLQKDEDPLIEKSLYYNAFERLETISKQIDDKVDEEVEVPKIAVFIDDLDRCNPPEAIKLLESIKLVLSQKGFIFTLALDKRILQGYLKYRYEEEFKVKEYETGGKDYLDKIIQLPLPLLPHEKRFENYITKLLDKNEALKHQSNQPVKDVIYELKDVLSKGARFNPRNLVRFLNNLIVDRLLWKTVDNKEADVKVMGFCVISRILRDHFKDDRLYEYLWRNQDVCEKIQIYVTEGEQELPAEEGKAEEADAKTKKVEDIIAKLREMEFLKEVLRTKQGKAWLEDENMRESVNQFIVEQRKEEEPDHIRQDDEKVLDHEIRRVLNIERGAISDKDYQSIEELDLSEKDIKILPARIAKLTNLQFLYLSGNQLTSLPEAIGKLTKLQYVSIHDNQLTTLPEAIGKLTALQTLALYNNQLTTVPEAIGKLPALKKLNLSGNLLTTLPEGICKLTTLQSLYLEGNQLTKLPEAIGNLTKLQSLYFEGNPLTNLPNTIGNIKALKVLDLSGNQLTHLPEAVGKLENLELLKLSGNRLTALPGAKGELRNLRELNLSNNHFTALPVVIAEQKNLKSLDLTRNQLTDLSEEISKLTTLRELYLGRNQLTSLPDAVVELKSLQKLDLSRNQLTALPEAICNLTNLQRLYLMGNQLTVLPEKIGKLTALLSLSLNNNQLTDLPKAIVKLTALKRLALSRNQLTTLPEEIDKLTALKGLYLAGNKLTTLPEAIVKLANLQELSLHHNQLTGLPLEIGKLTNLQSLNLSHNQFTALPGAIGKLIHLKMLDLENNKFSEEEKNRIKSLLPTRCTVSL